MKRFVNIVLFCISIFFFFYSTCVGIRSVFRYNNLKLELNILQTQLIKIQYLNIANKIKLNEMKQQEFWELEAKKRLDYVLSGEVIYKII